MFKMIVLKLLILLEINKLMIKIGILLIFELLEKYFPNVVVA